MSFFLRARSWQLFLLLFGLPFLFQLLMTVLMALRVRPDIVADFLFADLFVLLMSIGLYIGWIWTLAIPLQQRLPEALRRRTALFRLSLALPMGYMLLLLLFVQAVASSTGPEQVSRAWVYALIPAHLLATAAFFYCLYFAASTLSRVLLQRPAELRDWIGYFFLLWFYPIGVWFVQPEANRLETGTR